MGECESMRVSRCTLPFSLRPVLPDALERYWIAPSASSLVDPPNHGDDGDETEERIGQGRARWNKGHIFKRYHSITHCIAVNQLYHSLTRNHSLTHSLTLVFFICTRVRSFVMVSRSLTNSFSAAAINCRNSSSYSSSC